MTVRVRMTGRGNLLTGGVESLDYQGVYACRQIASGCLDGYLPDLDRQHAEEVVGVVGRSYRLAFRVEPLDLGEERDGLAAVLYGQVYVV